MDVSISASPILWNGRVEGAVGVYRDITERRKKEREIGLFQKKLESLKEFNENIVNGLAEGIVLEDTRGRIVFVNPSMERLLGFRADELAGRDPKGFISPEELARIRKKTRSRRSKATLETYETVLRAKDGTPVPVLVSARSLFEDGAFTGVLSAITNISRQKQAEAELEASRLEAQAANAAKSEFLANMSHEIRTPMNGIIGMTELALDTPLSPAQREYLNAIKTSADSLLVLINDILDFSKIEARMMDLEPVRFGLRDAIAETASFLALAAHRKGLELACRISPDVPDGLVGDIRRLRQVLINLTSNAIKFTARGRGRHRRDGGSPRTGAMSSCISPSRIRGSASPGTSRRPSSRLSSRPTGPRPGATAGRDWASPSPPASSSSWADGSGSKASRAQAAGSISRSGSGSSGRPPGRRRRPNPRRSETSPSSWWTTTPRTGGS